MLLHFVLIWSLFYTLQSKLFTNYVKFVKNEGGCNLTTIDYQPSGGDAKFNRLTSTISVTQQNILKKIIANNITDTLTSNNPTNFQYMLALFPDFTAELSRLAPRLTYTLDIFVSRYRLLVDTTKPPAVQITSTIKNNFSLNFTDVVLNRLEYMKTYMNECSIVTEENLVNTEFQKILYLWLDCIKQTKTSDINTCQQDALKYLRSLSPHFLFYDQSRKNNETVDICTVKRIEAGLFALRDYIFLNIMISETLIGSYELIKNESRSNLSYYKNFLASYISDLVDFKEYVTWAYGNIERVHLVNMCDVTSNCTETPIYKGTEVSTNHVTNKYTCFCNFDQTLDKQRCYAIFIGRLDGRKVSHEYYLAYSNEGNVAKSEAYFNLTANSIIYNTQLKGYLKAFWGNEILNMIPFWNEIIQNKLSLFKKVKLKKEFQVLTEDEELDMGYSAGFETRFKSFQEK